MTSIQKMAFVKYNMRHYYDIDPNDIYHFDSFINIKQAKAKLLKGKEVVN